MRSAALLYAALLAFLPQGQPQYCGEKKIPYDQVKPFPEKTPETFSELAAHKYKPTLIILHGCYPYAAVSADGAISGGLNVSGAPGAGCEGSSLGDQVYVRSMWLFDHWGMMFAWFAPKQSLGSGTGHSYDWKWVIIWLNNPDPAVSRVEAVTIVESDGETKENTTHIVPNRFADGVPKFRYLNRGDKHYVELSAEVGKTQTLVMWDNLTPAARCALNEVDWNEGKMPMSNLLFQDKMKIGWTGVERNYD